LTTQVPAGRAGVRVFDACQVGVVLRAVVFVEAAVAVGALFGVAGPADWLARWALATGAALPGVLAWLLVCCGLKNRLALLPDLGQLAAGAVLGAAAGLYGWGLMVVAGRAGHGDGLASALAGALLALVLAAGLFWRARARTPAATTARLQELQSRIRPHFLFNTLNSAIALVRDDPARAEALLEDLSDLFRHALAEPGHAVSLADEIALARRYLAIEAVRFGDRLRVSWSLDPAADGARLPHLLLQPLVENAVRHGVEPSDNGADLQIHTRVVGGRVLLEVSNTVPAGQGDAGQGMALANVRDRLGLLHDLAASLQAGLGADGIYRVRIEVPL
jgi:two-component system sensor histidine kinase AlgZ